MKQLAALLLALWLPAAQASLTVATLLIRCPDTEALRRWTIGGQLSPVWGWTDGYGTPRSDNEAISRCGPQGPIYRLEQAQVVDQVNHLAGQAMPAHWNAIPFAEAAGVADIAEALELGMATSREEERHWRMRLWWAANEGLRYLDPPTGAANPFARGKPGRDNLLRLLPLLDREDPKQRLLLAEALRALELYDEALRLLDGLSATRLGPAANTIRGLARRADPWVRPWEKTLHAIRDLRARQRDKASRQKAKP